MSDSATLSPRVTIQVRLALSRLDRASDPLTEDLWLEAKALGLTEAEIDAALSGRSFEAKACAAIALALAKLAGEPVGLSATRTHAEDFGLCPAEIKQVELLADTIAE